MTFRNMRAAATIATGCLLTLGATAQSPFAKALPNDTIGFFQFPNITESLKQMENAPIAKMWHEGEVQDFVADAMQILSAQWDEALAEGKKLHEQGEIPFDPTDLSKLEMHSLGVALTTLELTEFEGEPFPKFGIMGHVDGGQSIGLWKNVLSAVMELMVEESRGAAEMSTWNIGEAEVHSLTPADNEMPIGLHVAFAGNHLVFGTIKSELETFLGSLATGKSNLAATNTYTACARHVRVEGAEVEAFFQPNRVIDFVMSVLRMADEQGELPPFLDVAGIDRAIAALGLRSVGAVSGISAYEGDRCVSRGFVSSPKADRKGLAALAAGEADLSLLRWVPKDAASLSIGSADISSIYDAIVGAMQAYDEGMAEMMLGRLAGLEEQFGISLRKDLFGAFSGEFVSWQLPMASFTAAPEMAMIAKMKNKDGFLNALKRAAEMSQGRVSIEENKRRGIMVYQLILDMDLGGEFGFNPLAAFVPTFSFKDDYLVLAFSTSDIKRAFKRMDREDDPKGDIRTNEEFAPYLETLPREGVTNIAFRDWKAEFEAYYQIGTTLLAFVPLDDEIPLDFSLLPDSATLTQHLCGSVTWTRVTDEGVSTNSIGPWGPETIALMVGGIGAGAGAGIYMGSMQADMSDW